MTESPDTLASITLSGDQGDGITESSESIPLPDDVKTDDSLQRDEYSTDEEALSRHSEYLKQATRLMLKNSRLNHILGARTDEAKLRKLALYPLQCLYRNKTDENMAFVSEALKQYKHLDGEDYILGFPNFGGSVKLNQAIEEQITLLKITTNSF